MISAVTLFLVSFSQRVEFIRDFLVRSWGEMTTQSSSHQISETLEAMRMVSAGARDLAHKFDHDMKSSSALLQKIDGTQIGR